MNFFRLFALCHHCIYTNFPNVELKKRPLFYSSNYHIVHPLFSSDWVWLNSEAGFLKDVSCLPCSLRANQERSSRRRRPSCAASSLRPGSSSRTSGGKTLALLTSSRWPGALSHSRCSTRYHSYHYYYYYYLWTFCFFSLLNAPLVSVLSGVWSQSSVSKAPTQRPAGLGDAETHQVSPAAGQHHQTHWGWAGNHAAH